MSTRGVRPAAAIGLMLTLGVAGCVTPQTRFAPGGASQGYAYLIGGSSKHDQTNYWIASVGSDRGRIDAAELSSADTFIGIAIEAGQPTLASYRINGFQGGGGGVVSGPWFTPQVGRCYIAGFYAVMGADVGSWVDLTPTDRASPVSWGSRNDRPRMREVGRDDGLWPHCEKVAKLVG